MMSLQKRSVPYRTFKSTVLNVKVWVLLLVVLSSIFGSVFISIMPYMWIFSISSPGISHLAYLYSTLWMRLPGFRENFDWPICVLKRSGKRYAVAGSTHILALPTYLSKTLVQTSSLVCSRLMQTCWPSRVSLSPSLLLISRPTWNVKTTQYVESFKHSKLTVCPYHLTIFFQTAFKAVNESVGSDGLVPTLSVFGAYSRLEFGTDNPNPSNAQRVLRLQQSKDALTTFFA